MKQVLITLGVLLLSMFGFYWASNRNPIKIDLGQTVTDQGIYFEVPEKLEMETETDILLKAKYKSGKLVNYTINFSYDPANIEILNVEVNKDVFDKKAEAEIDKDFGKVIVSGENVKNRNEIPEQDLILATIKIKGLKKGGTMIYASRRPETGIWENNKVVEGNLEMPNFKLNFL